MDTQTLQTQSVLDFWFSAPGSAQYGNPRKEWFQKNFDFDEKIRARFSSLHDAAARGELREWEAQPHGLLALIILLDQFPRNLFRNTARAFVTDAQALAHAQTAVAKKLDAVLLPIQRLFVYLPFEHSEDLLMQQQALELFSALAKQNAGFDGYLDYARRHHDVVKRFGRFPHRNVALNRASTAEEMSFLAQPGSGF